MLSCILYLPNSFTLKDERDKLFQLVFGCRPDSDDDNQKNSDITDTNHELIISAFQASKGGLVMINFFSYFITCKNVSTMSDVIGKNIFLCPQKYFCPIG